MLNCNIIVFLFSIKILKRYFSWSKFIIGITIIPLEVSRIIAGSLNRLTTGSYRLYPNYNFDLNGNSTYIRAFIPDIIGGNNPTLGDAGIVPQPAVGLIAPGNYPIQDKYLWPWSHAALLFSLVVSLNICWGFWERFKQKLVYNHL